MCNLKTLIHRYSCQTSLLNVGQQRYTAASIVRFQNDSLTNRFFIMNQNTTQLCSPNDSITSRFVIAQLTLTSLFSESKTYRAISTKWLL